jgi:hypothetical protein
VDDVRLGHRTCRSGGRLEKSQDQRACPESIGHQGSHLDSSPYSFRITPPVTNRVVSFEQQRWKGEIVKARHVRQGRGRPRKQYLIKWESSWVDSGRLAAPELIEKWEGKGCKDVEGL